MSPSLNPRTDLVSLEFDLSFWFLWISTNKILENNISSSNLSLIWVVGVFIDTFFSLCLITTVNYFYEFTLVTWASNSRRKTRRAISSITHVFSTTIWSRIYSDNLGETKLTELRRWTRESVQTRIGAASLYFAFVKTRSRWLQINRTDSRFTRASKIHTRVCLRLSRLRREGGWGTGFVKTTPYVAPPRFGLQLPRRRQPFLPRRNRVSGNSLIRI